jgi:hypothetical protein
MTRSLTLLGFLLVAPRSAADSPDLLRFTNGDQLHGTFLGVQAGGLTTWQREDLSDPVVFKSTLLRHVVLRHGKSAIAPTSLSSVSLVNGDQIPGTMTAMDDKSITLSPPFGEPLILPRDQIAALAPNPLGGRLHYYGPFSKDGWKTAGPPLPQGTTIPEAPSDWNFSGSSWIWPTGKLPISALIRENAMLDRSVIRFDLQWKNQLFLAIAFNADFTKPKPPPIDDPSRRAGPLTPGDPSVLPMLFGNSYVFQVFTTHLSLLRTVVNEDGIGSIERIQLNGNPSRLNNSGKATLEIRSNRDSGEITLFIDGEFLTQWSDPSAMASGVPTTSMKGSGIGFLVQALEVPVKISDVMISEWNGMPDSARSLQVDEQDIVLLANGTDRFSGRVFSFAKGQLGVASKLGDFHIPITDIAEVRFAKKYLAPRTGPALENLSIRLSPFGQISGTPQSGNAASITLKSTTYGQTTVHLDSAVMLEFQPSTPNTDDWNVEF